MAMHHQFFVVKHLIDIPCGMLYVNQSNAYHPSCRVTNYADKLMQDVESVLIADSATTDSVTLGTMNVSAMPDTLGADAIYARPPQILALGIVAWLTQDADCLSIVEIATTMASALAGYATASTDLQVIDVKIQA